MNRWAAFGGLLALSLAAGVANADDSAPPGAIIFARNGSLVRVDTRGKGETEIATFEPNQHVRSLRTDAAGKVLLADLDGLWAWMPLDGSAKSLSPLPCADGPAQLADDGSAVVCRAKQGALEINFQSGKQWAIDVPVARIVGAGATRKLIWAASDGVWAAPPSTSPRAKATKVAPEPPLRGFLPSPDGTRALGVYASEIYTDAHRKQPAEVLMGFALDGIAARRKAIKTGVGLEWSHDGEWILVQDGASACLMHATGGEYKCWRGFTGASLSPDGKFALVLGNRDAKVLPQTTKKPSEKEMATLRAKSKAMPAPAPQAAPPTPSDSADESDDAEGGDVPDVAVPPPTGPLSLYRARLEGSAFTEPPTLIARIVDGAAVWVPDAPAPVAP